MLSVTGPSLQAITCLFHISEGRTRPDREADDQQVLQLEGKDVVSSVATVLSDSCGPGEYMAMEKLHSVVSSIPSSSFFLFWI